MAGTDSPSVNPGVSLYAADAVEGQLVDDPVDRRYQALVELGRGPPTCLGGGCRPWHVEHATEANDADVDVEGVLANPAVLALPLGLSSEPRDLSGWPASALRRQREVGSNKPSTSATVRSCLRVTPTAERATAVLRLAVQRFTSSRGGRLAVASHAYLLVGAQQGYATSSIRAICLGEHRSAKKNPRHSAGVF